MSGGRAGVPDTRAVHLTLRGRTAAVALGATAVIAGGVLVALGLTLIAGLVVVGTAAGGSTMLFRRLTGRHAGRSRHRYGLDPAQEVFPVSVQEAPRLPAPAPPSRSSR